MIAYDIYLLDYLWDERIPPCLFNFQSPKSMYICDFTRHSFDSWK